MKRDKLGLHIIYGMNSLWLPVSWRANAEKHTHTHPHTSRTHHAHMHTRAHTMHIPHAHAHTRIYTTQERTTSLGTRQFNSAFTEVKYLSDSSGQILLTFFIKSLSIILSFFILAHKISAKIMNRHYLYLSKSLTEMIPLRVNWVSAGKMNSTVPHKHAVLALKMDHFLPSNKSSWT